MTLHSKIATASMSREIFLALGITGLFNTPQPLCGYPFILHRHPPTRGEACHWILSRLRLPTNPVPLPPQAVPPIAFAMKVSHWIFARLRLPTNPVRLLFPLKREGCRCFGGAAAGPQFSSLNSKKQKVSHPLDAALFDCGEAAEGLDLDLDLDPQVLRPCRPRSRPRSRSIYYAPLSTLPRS